MGGPQNQIGSVRRSILQGENLRRVLSVLPEKEFRVICLRYGLFGGREHTQREVAALSGISRSYVSRIEKSAVEHLRDAMEQPEKT